MSKYFVKVKVKCGEDIKLQTDDESKIRELEEDIITQAYLHERKCTKCASIRIYEEEIENENSKYRVQSVANCGEILSIERINPHEVAKVAMERDVYQQVAEHRRTCVKCIRIEKLDEINGRIRIHNKLST